MSTVEEQKWPQGLCPTDVYLVGFLRAFSRALKILRSHVGVLFPGLMSPALSRADRAEIGRSALGDDWEEGGSGKGGGGTSTSSLKTASAAGAGPGGAGEEVKSGVGELEMV